jgi:hypothetical protein
MKTAISIPEEVYAHARKRVEEGRATSISGYFADLAKRDMSLPTLEEIFSEWDAEDGIVRTKDETRDADAWAEEALIRADTFYRNRKAAE